MIVEESLHKTGLDKAMIGSISAVGIGMSDAYMSFDGRARLTSYDITNNGLFDTIISSEYMENSRDCQGN